MNTFKVSLLQKRYLLLLSTFSYSILQADTAELPSASSTESVQTVDQSQHEDAQCAQLFTKLKVQLDMLQSMCQTIAHIRAQQKNYTQATTQTEESNAFLFHLGNSMSICAEENSLYVNKNQVVLFAQMVSRYSDIIANIITYGLDGFAKRVQHFTPKDRCITISATNYKTLESKDIEKLVQELDIELRQTLQAVNQIGLSRVNKMYRKVSSVWQRYGLGDIAERLVVYPSILTWVLYRTDKEQVRALPWVPEGIKEWICDKKESYSGKPGKKLDPLEADLPLKAIITDEDGNVIEKNKMVRVLKQKTVVNPDKTKRIENIDGTFTYDTIDNLCKRYNETHNTALTSEEYGNTFGYDISAKHVSRLQGSDDSNIQKNSSLANLAYGIETIAKFTGDNIFKIPVDVLAMKYITEDLFRLQKKVGKLKGIIDDKLRGAIKQRTWTEVALGTDRFKDIVGRDEIKDYLKLVIDYVCYPEKYDRTNITVEKGILFSGPSQNGKSAMISALANEMDDALARAGKAERSRVFKLEVKDLINPLTDKDGKVISSQTGLSYYISLAQHMGHPVVIVIDEIDMLSLQRDRDNKMLADMLTAMSNGLSASEKNMVIIIGLTNKPQNLDFALLQHGRFGKQFKFEKPAYQDRYQFFVKECERRMIDPRRFDLAKLAHDTESASYGTLLSVTKKAFLTAQHTNVGITQAHFEHALDTEYKNIQFNSNELPLSKQTIIAAHQAGKALVSYLLKPSKQLCKVTILPCIQAVKEESAWMANTEKNPVFKETEQNTVHYGNIFSYSHEDTFGMEIKEELEKECRILVAGTAGQEVAELKEHAFERQDKQEALAIARKLASHGFENLAGMSKVETQKILEHAMELLRTYQQDATRLLKEHKKAFDAICKELLEKKILTYEDIDRIVKAHQ